MAVDFSNSLGKLVELIAKAVVVNSAYLTRGARKVPVDQMKGKIVGDEYNFVIPNVSANYSTQLDSDGKISLATVSAPTKVSAKIAYAGTSMPLGAISKALELGDYKLYAQEIASAIVNKFAIETAKVDITKIAYQAVASDYKGVAKASAKLAATYQGKQYGFADPVVIGELQGDGRNAQPINIEPQFGVGLEGKLFNINELRSMNLIESSAVSGVFNGAAVSTIGNEVSLTGATAGQILIHEDSNGKPKCVVIATASNKGKLLYGTSPNGGTTAVASVGGYRPILMRLDGAQVWGDAGDCIDGADEKITVEGITIACSKVKQGGFAVNYEFAMAGVAAVAEEAKCGIVWMKA